MRSNHPDWDFAYKDDLSTKCHMCEKELEKCNKWAKDKDGCMSCPKCGTVYLWIVTEHEFKDGRPTGFWQHRDFATTPERAVIAKKAILHQAEFFEKEPPMISIEFRECNHLLASIRFNSRVSITAEFHKKGEYESP
jgi:hypothetical protein